MIDYKSVFKLNKKKAIVVGSNGLLGLEIVKALLSQRSYSFRHRFKKK